MELGMGGRKGERDRERQRKRAIISQTVIIIDTQLKTLHCHVLHINMYHKSYTTLEHPFNNGTA